jgi:cyclophilin family peptidyl-prolyl cis-trans isomerase
MWKLHAGSKANSRRTARGTPPLYRKARFEVLEDRHLLSLTLPAISSVTVPVLAPVPVVLNGSDSVSGSTISYSVTSSDPSVVAPILTSTSNPTIQISTNLGNMTFQLYSDLVPNAVGYFLNQVNAGTYSSQSFYRVVSDFVIQGGVNGGGSGPTFDDQFNSDLRFTTTGVLAMANSGADTNDSEFFITDGAQRSLDFRYTILGFETSGDSVRAAIQAAAVGGSSGTTPTSTITINSITVVPSQSDVLLLSVPTLPASTNPVTITVTATDSSDPSAAPVTQTFQVTPAADTDPDATAPPYLASSPLTLSNGSTATSVSVPVNGSTSFNINAVDLYGTSNLTYTATLASPPASGSAAELSTPVVDASTGQVTITPVADATPGVYGIKLGVSDPDDAITSTDTQVVPVLVDPLAPAITLMNSSDGVHTSDNNSAGNLLEFDVTGVQPGASVTVYADGTAIGTATASATATSVDVTTNGTSALSEGAHSITVTQSITESDVTVGNSTNASYTLASNASAALPIKVALAADQPTLNALNSSYPVVATNSLSVPITANEQDANDTLTFSLGAGAPAGAQITKTSATTAVVSWTPPEIDGGQSFAIPVEVIDAGDLSANATVTVDVQKLQRPPVFASTGQSLLVAPGGTLQTTVSATDPDYYSYPITYSLAAGAPAGATIDPQTGVLTWAVPASTAGGTTVPISVTATEVSSTPLANPSSSETLNVQVVSPQAPVFASVPPTALAATPGKTLQVPITASDPTAYNYPVTYSLAAGAPAGASINPQTGVLTYAVPANFTVPTGGTTVPINVTATEVGGAGLATTETVNVHLATSAASVQVIAEEQGTATGTNLLLAPTLVSGATLPAANAALALQNLPIVLPPGGVGALYGYGNVLENTSLFGNTYVPDLGHGSVTTPSKLQEPKVEPSQSSSDTHSEFRLDTPEYVGDPSQEQQSADAASSDAPQWTEVVAATDAAIAALGADEA